MTRKDVATQVEWRLPAGYRRVTTRPSGQRPRTRGVRTPTEGEEPLALDDVLPGFADEQLELVDDAVVTRDPKSRPARRGAPPAKPATVHVELAPRETAVALIERDGVLKWQFADKVAHTRARRGVGADSVRVATFTVQLSATQQKAPPRQRGLLDSVGGKIKDKVVERVRVVVFKFLAGVVAGQAIRFFERHISPELIALTPPDDRQRGFTSALPARAPAGRRPHVLLFLPGTFGGVTGCFGALRLYPWGEQFLNLAHHSYDEVLGYEHRTLSEDPLANAVDLLERLHARYGDDGARIDLVAYSRGGLVARSLIEQVLPSASSALQVERLVLVASPNSGTHMADVANWKHLVDLYTNLGSAVAWALGLLPQTKAASEVVKQVVKGVGALVKTLAETALDDDVVPGLAAMTPDGKFVTQLNKKQRGQPEPGRVRMYAATATFEAKILGGDHEPRDLPRRLVEALADGFADQLIRGPNDLIVDTKSMIALDPGVAGYFADVFEFGTTPYVHHLNYFTRPDIAQALTRWLDLEDGQGAQAVLPAGSVAEPAPSAAVSTDVVTLDADEAAADALEVIAEHEPAYVVVKDRPRAAADEGVYVYATDEVVASLPRRSRARIGVALDLGDGDMADVTAVSTELQEAAPRGRAPAVVMGGGGVARGVQVRAPRLDMAELAATAEDVRAPRNLAARSRRRRLVPAEAAPPRRAKKRSAAQPRTGKDLRHGPRRAAVPSRLEVFVRAEMHTELPLDKPTELTVELGPEELAPVKGTGQKAGKVKANAKDDLTVQCVPKRGVVIEGENEHTIPRSWIGEPATITFTLRGAAVGDAEVWVIVRQGTTSLLRLKLEGTVKRARTRSSRRQQVEAVATDQGSRCALPVTLDILEETVGENVVYNFRLLAPDYGIRRAGRSDPIKGRNEYVAGVYQGIEERWFGSNQSMDAFHAELEDYGAELFDVLVPENIRDGLWKLRNKVQAILVGSEEPFIPWEIVRVKDPKGTSAKGRFLGEMGLTRWLWNLPKHETPPCELRVAEGRAHYIVPRYPIEDLELPKTPAEGKFMAKKFQATEVEARDAAVRKLLAGPKAFDLLHFAGHGEADHANIRDAQILLTGEFDEDGKYVYERFLASSVRQRAVLSDADDDTGPIVVLNACRAGRLGERLTTVGGFAESFLATGAGAFVSSLWSVYDEPAVGFAQAFYNALLKGKTVAEATRAGRERARADGDATWAAYVVYAHPAAKLVKT